jgi:methylisocitrate lyase
MSPRKRTRARGGAANREGPVNRRPSGEARPNKSPGRRFRDTVASHAPVQIPGTINAYSALLAERTGFKAIYVSGAGVANASFGLPDLGMTTLSDVLEDVRRITAACPLPLLVDVDTGFGGAFNIARTTREMIRAGAAAIHIEDQELAKRCGHRPNKATVSPEEMCDRIKAAVDARIDADFVIMARTDAFAREGRDATLARVASYVEAGADMIFAEALYTLDGYRAFTQAVKIPVLANLTEFGLTPSFTVRELGDAGVKMILYPLSAFRAMSKAALDVYTTILDRGTQKLLLGKMQTREELYAVLGYHDYERKLDELFAEARKGKEGRKK